MQSVVTTEVDTETGRGFGMGMNKERNPLGDLIDKIREEQTWSDYDLARMAIHAGHQHLTKSNISRIRNTPVRTLMPNQVRALADVLGVSPREIIRVTLDTLGLPSWDAAPTAEVAIQDDRTIAPETKRVMLAMLKAARDSPPAVTGRGSELGSNFQDRQDSVSPAVPPNGGSSVLRGVEAAGQLDDATPAGDDQTLETGMIIADDDAPGAAAESKARAARKRADAPVEPNRSVGRRRRSGGSS